MAPALLRLALAALALVCPLQPAAAQLAVASDVTVRSTSATYANGSGFRFAASGPLLYDGPINDVSRGQVPPTLSLLLNGDQLVDAIVPRVAAALPAEAVYPRLSPRLAEAQLLVGASLSGELGETLPLFTAAGASRQELILESVDGQSFSVYPRFSPSLQLPREAGLYSDPNNPNNPNAANAGPRLIDPDSNTVF